MLARAGRLLPYSGQVAAINIPRAALPFSSINSFSRSRGRVTATIRGEIGANFKLAGCPSWRQTHLWDWPIICWCADNGAVVFFRWHHHRMQFKVLPRTFNWGSTGVSVGVHFCFRKYSVCSPKLMRMNNDKSLFIHVTINPYKDKLIFTGP